MTARLELGGAILHGVRVDPWLRQARNRLVVLLERHPHGISLVVVDEAHSDDCQRPSLAQDLGRLRVAELGVDPMERVERNHCVEELACGAPLLERRRDDRHAWERRDCGGTARERS